MLLIHVRHILFFVPRHLRRIQEIKHVVTQLPTSRAKGSAPGK
jgi:hypothetical protein